MPLLSCALMCTPGPCDKVAAMIRQRRRRRPAWAAGLAILGVLAAGPARADDAALLAARVAKAQKLVEKVRGLSFRAPVASALLPEKDLEDVLGKKLVEDLPVPFETYAASLEAIGLIENSPDLLLRLTRLYARQVVGFYDPAEKRFYIVPERSRDTAGPAGELMEQLLLAHELMHALQDQRLDLDKRMKSLMDSTDALLALQAVLEGEATLLMTEALMESVPADAREALGSDPTQQILDGLDSPAAVEGAEGVPDFFVKELVFPYAAGTAWVRQKRKVGGWAAIDGVYRNLPSTTSEILRPGTVLAPRKRLAASDRPTRCRENRRLLDDLVRHARRVGPRESPRAGRRRRRREGRCRRVAGRPGRLLLVEGVPVRRRHRLPLENSSREPRRGEADRRAARTSLRQTVRRRKTLGHDAWKRRRGRPPCRSAPRPPEGHPGISRTTEGRIRRSCTASKTPCATIDATTDPVFSNVADRTAVIARRPKKKSGSP